MRVLLTGDDFISPDLFRTSLEREIGDNHEWVMRQGRFPTDDEALIEALVSGQLSGAALDVYAPHEPPLPDNPLLSMPNVVAVSHLAGASKHVAERAVRLIAAEAARFVRGEPLLHQVNPEVVPRAFA